MTKIETASETIEQTEQQKAYLKIIRNYKYPEGITCHDLVNLINSAIDGHNNRLDLGAPHVDHLQDTRAARTIKDELLDQGYPLGSDSDNGYYWIPAPVKGMTGQYESEGADAASKEHYSKSLTHRKRGDQVQKNTFEFYQTPPTSLSLAAHWTEKQ